MIALAAHLPVEGAVKAYLSGTFTAGIGFVGWITNWCARGRASANASKPAVMMTSVRM
jgi:hypothetical protein